MKHSHFIILLWTISLFTVTLKADETLSEIIAKSNIANGTGMSTIEDIEIIKRTNPSTPLSFFYYEPVLNYYSLNWEYRSILMGHVGAYEGMILANIFKDGGTAETKRNEYDGYIVKKSNVFDDKFVPSGKDYVNLNAANAVGLWKYGNMSDDAFTVVSQFLRERLYYSGIRKEKVSLVKVMAFLDNAVPVILTHNNKMVMVLGYIQENESAKLIYYSIDDTISDRQYEYNFSLKTAVIGRKGIGIMNWDGEGEMITIDWPRISYFLLMKTL